MAVTINWAKDSEHPPYISDRRVFLTADNRVTTEDDPEAATLLVGVGGSIPYEVALRHGLVSEEKHAEKPQETKHVPGPPSTKKGGKGEVATETKEHFTPIGGAEIDTE